MRVFRNRRVVRYAVRTAVRMVCICIVLAAAPQAAHTAADAAQSPGDVVIAGEPRGNEALAACTAEAVAEIAQAFERCGRFIPVDNTVLQRAAAALGANAAGRQVTVVDATAALKARLCVIVAVSQAGNVYTGEATIIPFAAEDRAMKRTITVRSGIMMNIPLKLAMSIASLHAGLPIRAEIVHTYGGGLCRVDAGQWHGLAQGRCRTGEYGEIDVKSTGRYDAVVQIYSGNTAEGSPMTVLDYPRTRPIAAEIDSRIMENTLRRYGMKSQMPGDDPEKRYIEGICVINPGANACLPGYGAFMATQYLGFRDSAPDTAGIALGASSITAQLLLPSLMTGFSIHFFPWVKDSDKSESMRNFQGFLWMTIPFTVTATYLDQLAVQFSKAEVLPPFFADKDVMAAFLSGIIPGGGFFYKGRRIAGWSFYFSEMMLAGYGVYSADHGRRSAAAFAALGAIKLFEIVDAFITRPSYSFYMREVERGSGDVTLSAGFGIGNPREPVLSLGAALTL